MHGRYSLRHNIYIFSTSTRRHNSATIWMQHPRGFIFFRAAHTCTAGCIFRYLSAALYAARQGSQFGWATDKDAHIYPGVAGGYSTTQKYQCTGKSDGARTRHATRTGQNLVFRFRKAIRWSRSNFPPPVFFRAIFPKNPKILSSPSYAIESA